LRSSVTIAVSIFGLCGCGAVGTGVQPSSGARPSAQPTSSPAGQWSDLPPSPVQPRSWPSAVWTGREAIFWGGLVNGHISASEHTDSVTFADGAAYNPRQHSWRKVRQAPLSPRFNTATVWTGSVMFIWGGRDSASNALSDGALYDPATDSWRKTAPSPLASGLTAFWTGKEVEVWGGGPGLVPNSNPAITAGAAYNPKTDAWRQLAAPPAAPIHTVVAPITGWTGDRLVLWNYWEHTTPTGPNSTITNAGLDVDLYDAARDQWRSLSSAGSDFPPTLGARTFWTGKEFVVWAGGRGHGPPPGLDNPGYLFNPENNSWRRMGRGPIDAGGADAAVWTGSAMVAITGSEVGAPNGEGMSPGDGGKYTASMNSWVRIPRAPGATDYSAAAVWAGDQVILWGADASRPNPAYSYKP
jgi:hypothetical protein